MGRAGRERQKKEDQIRERKKEDQGARKGRKVAKHCVFPMFRGSEGPKVGSLKRRVRSLHAVAAGSTSVCKSKR